MRQSTSLRLRMLVVTAALPVLGLGAFALVAGVLFVYYLLFVPLAVLAVWLAVVVLVSFLFPGIGVATNSLGLWAAVSLWATLAMTCWRLYTLCAPAVREELRGERTVLAGPAHAAPERFPGLRTAVPTLAQQYALPTPELVVVETSTPEAMALGYRPSTTTLVLSTGLLDALSPEERDAVVAHELAHVRNRDAALMTLTTLPLVFARRAVEEGRNAEYDPDDLRGLVTANVLLFLLAYPVAFVGRTLAAALSRTREAVADHAAAVATGSPAALATALETLDSRMHTVPGDDLRGGSREAMVSILPPTDHERPGYFPYLRRWLVRNVYHTHPPTERRVRSLRALERENERS